MTRVFVYGSLKQGYHNHGLLQGSHCLGKARTDGFVLYSLGSFPAAIAGDNVLQGEAYEVDEQTLKALDCLEGHPHMYKRIETTCFVENLNGSLPCLIYVYQHELGGEPILTGEW